eukprot:m.155118 g.155118  ORF g.155118 m.155118 type:complete len:66 (+) comp38658_c0_seq8:1922-2119(+)
MQPMPGISERSNTIFKTAVQLLFHEMLERPQGKVEVKAQPARPATVTAETVTASARKIASYSDHL